MPNHADAALACGNLGESDLAAVVRDSPVMQQMRTCCHVAHYDRCRTCTFRYWCAGDCRGEVRAAIGNLLAPSPHCGELRRV